MQIISSMNFKTGRMFKVIEKPFVPYLISSNVALDIILEGYLLDPTSAFSDACRHHESEVTENDVKVFKTPIGRLSTDPKILQAPRRVQVAVILRICIVN